MKKKRKIYYHYISSVKISAKINGSSFEILKTKKERTIVRKKSITLNRQSQLYQQSEG